MIPCASINAYSMKADNGEYLVILNERLMGLINTWHELEACSIQKLSTDNDNNDFAKNFSPILESFLTPSSGNILPVFSFEDLSSESQHIALMRSILCVQFILAHELAHIYLGHISQANRYKMINDEFWVTYDANNDLQQMEFDADIQASKWLISLSKVNSRINPFQKTPFFFLNVFTIFSFNRM